MKEKIKVSKMLKRILIGVLFVQCVVFSTVVSAQGNKFPYKLKKIDYALLPLGFTIQLLGENWVDNKATISLEDIALLNRNDVNAFDRSATNIFSVSADNISDLTRTSLVLIPGLIIGHQLIQEEWKNAITYSIMYYEAFLYTKGLTALVKAATSRTRPYLYNDDLTVEERYEYTITRDSYGSFFSGHTSAMFASAVMLSKTFTDIYGKSNWSKLVWGTALTAASVGSYYRYRSGEHYPTDVITGALVGAAIGYVIPVLHSIPKNNRINLSVNPGSIYFSYRF